MSLSSNRKIYNNYLFRHNLINYLLSFLLEFWLYECQALVLFSVPHLYFWLIVPLLHFMDYPWIISLGLSSRSLILSLTISYLLFNLANEFLISIFHFQMIYVVLFWVLWLFLIVFSLFMSSILLFYFFKSISSILKVYLVIPILLGI